MFKGRNEGFWKGKGEFFFFRVREDGKEGWFEEI